MATKKFELMHKCFHKQMCGHVVRREETEILGKTQLVVAPERRPPGRPKKTWRKNMQELASLNLQEEQAQKRDQ